MRINFKLSKDVKLENLKEINNKCRQTRKLSNIIPKERHKRIFGL